MLKAFWNSVVIVLFVNGLLLYLYLQVQATMYRGDKTNNIITTSENKIFFLETSFRWDLNSRQACSVESAARSNPDWAVNVIFTAPRPRPRPRAYASATLAALAALPNVFLQSINITDLIEGTPLAPLFINNTLSHSEYPVTHTSDILRILVLNVYGGVYLDLDMIVVKSFNRLPRNFVAKEIWYELATGVLAVGRDPAGRLFADTAIRELMGSSNDLPSGAQWTGYGAQVLLRTMRTLCRTTHLYNMRPHRCRGFRIFESKYFYPIPYERWNEYFENISIEERGAAGGDSYTHHTWGSLSANASVHNDSLLARLARTHCPTVHSLYGDNFGA